MTMPGENRRTLDNRSVCLRLSFRLDSLLIRSVVYPRPRIPLSAPYGGRRDRAGRWSGRDNGQGAVGVTSVLGARTEKGPGDVCALT
jgi:hypothetical protein